MIETRPWGQYEILLDAEHTKVKRITVKPEGLLSLQYHMKRREAWTIVSGWAEVEVDGIKEDKKPGETILIPMGVTHRVGNNGSEDLVFIEVQTGTYFGEDDIIRLEDSYGRS